MAMKNFSLLVAVAFGGVAEAHKGGRPYGFAEGSAFIGGDSVAREASACASAKKAARSEASKANALLTAGAKRFVANVSKNCSCYHYVRANGKYRGKRVSRCTVAFGLEHPAEPKVASVPQCGGIAYRGGLRVMEHCP